MPEPRPAPTRLAYALGLVLMLLLSSSLIALRGVAMLGHMAVKTEAGLNTVHSPLGHSHSGQPQPKPQGHFEHCPLCFTYMVAVPGLEETLSRWLETRHTTLELYAAQARKEFLHVLAARAPPQGA
jgi:hypothetical protein